MSGDHSSPHHRETRCRCSACLQRLLDSSRGERRAYYLAIAAWVQAVTALADAVAAPRTLTPAATPAGLWQANLRFIFTPTEWEYVRTSLLDHVGNRCEVCGAGPSSEEPLECHEVFDWNIDTQVSTLVRVLALCRRCHHTQHIGLAAGLGVDREMRAHLQRVNRWTPRQTSNALSEVQHSWSATRNMNWSVDLSAIGLDPDEARMDAARRRAQSKRREIARDMIRRALS